MILMPKDFRVTTEVQCLVKINGDFLEDWRNPETDSCLPYPCIRQMYTGEDIQRSTFIILYDL